MAIESGPRIVTNGLIYDLDGAVSRSYSGSGLTVYDAETSAIGGTLVNGVTYSSNNNGYFVFDGTNDYINVGNDSSLQISSGTISAWARTSSPGGSFRGIVAKQFAYGIFYNDSVFVAYDWQASATRSSGINIADGAWKNLVLTFSGGIGSLYLNGSSVLSTTYNINNNSYNLFIGAEANAGQYAACNIAQVLVYNRAITASEVLQNYNTTKKRYGL
jgi:hypothetical protein